MTEVRDQFDHWLDTAMSEYSDVAQPVGFQERTIQSLRRERTRRRWIPLVSLGGAVAALVVFAVMSVPRVPPAPPLLHVQMTPPAVEKVWGERVMPQVQRQVVIRLDATRGVPLVPAPLTSSEKAVIHVLRNSHALQLASFALPDRGLGKESNPLLIEELKIPLVGKEER